MKTLAEFGRHRYASHVAWNVRLQIANNNNNLSNLKIHNQFYSCEVASLQPPNEEAGMGATAC